MRLTPAMTRPFDLRYLSNRLVLLGTPASGVVAGAVTLLRTGSIAEAASVGFWVGGSFFVAWAVARELDPDRPVTAVIAACVAPWAIVVARPDLLASAVVLLVARAVAGTTGRWMRWADVVLFTAVGGSSLVDDAAVGPLGVGVLAMLLVAARFSESRTQPAVIAVLFAIGTGLAVAGAPGGVTMSTEGRVILVAGGVVGLLGSLRPSRVDAATDRRGGSVSASRVRAARFVATASAGVAALVADPAAMAPVWAAVVTVAVPGGTRPPQE